MAIIEFITSDQSIGIALLGPRQGHHQLRIKYKELVGARSSTFLTKIHHIALQNNRHRQILRNNPYLKANKIVQRSSCKVIISNRIRKFKKIRNQ